MARSRQRPSRAATPRPPARATKATSRMGAPSAEVEVLEEAEGWGVSEGALVVTFVLLLIALGFVDYAMGSLYGAGMLF